MKAFTIPRHRGRGIARLLRAPAIILLCVAGGIIPALGDSPFDDQMNQAVDYIKAGEWGKLGVHAEKMLLERPEHLWANYYAGLGFTNSGQLEKGERYLLKALQIDPSQFWPNYVLFFNWSRQNKKSVMDQADKVEKSITPDIIKNSPGEIKFFFIEYARRFSNLKDQAKTREVLERALTKLPKEPILKVQLASTYFRVDMKKWEKLSRETLSLVPKSEQTATLVYQLPLKGGRIKVHQGNNEAISHLGLANGYSWDFVMVDEKGDYAKDYSKKESHYVFGQTVYAAQNGTVWSVYDKSPDSEPLKNNPDYGENTVVIMHASGETSVYVHLKMGSAMVKAGDQVTMGQPIGLVGCSGRFVDIPHLHFGVYRNGYSVEAALSGFSDTPEVPVKNQILDTGYKK